MMKTKKLLALLGIGAVGLTAMSTTVKAEEIVNSGESSATVIFEANTGVPSLINPDDPNEPFEEGNGTNESGPLSLDHVPTINFGSDNKISATQEIYPAKNGSYPPFVQVTDNRGTGAGWQLDATFSGFYETETDDKGNETHVSSLPGAKIIFSNNPDNIVSNGAPENKKPETTSSVELSKSAATDMVMKAETDKGMGSWALVWPVADAEMNKNIQLEVPGGIATTGAHEATIMWKLKSVPVPDETPTDTEVTE